MKRKIIKIDESSCNGCGNCISGCAEGALQLVDGKAKLVREDFCDGFGDCIGTCPTGALTIEERDVDAFDEAAVKENLRKTLGGGAVKRMEEAQSRHHHSHIGCPSVKNFFVEKKNVTTTKVDNQNIDQINPSDLQQWPVQLHLVNSANPAFANRELVIMSTCAPLASADVHWRYLRGRAVVVACPKLDRTESYIEKLISIFKVMNNRKAIIVRMEVPCCGGLTAMAKTAAQALGDDSFVLEEQVIGTDGKLKEVNRINF